MHPHISAPLTALTVSLSVLSAFASHLPLSHSQMSLSAHLFFPLPHTPFFYAAPNPPFFLFIALPPPPDPSFPQLYPHSFTPSLLFLSRSITKSSDLADKKMGREEERSRDGLAEKSCDFCGEAAAVVYCRADAARLCLPCDRHVHAANSVSSGHGRSLLCDVCRAAAATILCVSACRSALCTNCDFDAHRTPLQFARHERRQLEGFSGCPSASELASILGVGGEEKVDLSGDVVGEYLVEDASVWETPLVFRLDDLIVPTTACHGFQAIGVPPLPKRQISACGKHEEDITHQIRELMKLESPDKNESFMIEPAIGFESVELYEKNDIGLVEPANEFQSQVANQNDQHAYLELEVYYGVPWTGTQTHENLMLEMDQNDSNNPINTSLVAPGGEYLGTSSAADSLYSNETADIQINASYNNGNGDKDQDDSVNIEKMLVLPSRSGHELVCPDRSLVISRYKEKRKTRRYDKVVRYESRKVRADSRVRIKGRFAKMNEIPKVG